MSTRTTIDPAAGPLTHEDVAHFADGSGELPGDTAARLQALIRCDDLDRVERTWRLIGAQLEELRRMAEDADVELLVDAVFVFRILERLRSETWESPHEMLHPGVEVPYPPLIAMVGVMAERAEGEESAELLALHERLTIAQDNRACGEKLLDFLVARLLEVDEEAAEGALDQLVAIYRHRRAAAS